MAHKDHSPRFSDLIPRPSGAPLYLYAGNVLSGTQQDADGYYGLALEPGHPRDLPHDISKPVPLPNDCCARFQSEDVFEHVDYAQLPKVFAEIYRLLEPGGLFRLSLPDYRCDLLLKRALYDAEGKLVFDPNGGGHYSLGGVGGGGHVWFPTYETVKALFDQSSFAAKDVQFLHYYGEDGTGVVNPIDYSLGSVRRTPDFDDRVQSPRRPMSIVVDAYKTGSK